MRAGWRKREGKFPTKRKNNARREKGETADCYRDCKENYPCRCSTGPARPKGISIGPSLFARATQAKSPDEKRLLILPRRMGLQGTRSEVRERRRENTPLDQILLSCPNVLRADRL